MWAWHTPGHATPTSSDIPAILITGLKQFFILIFRAQNLYCWSGQCRKNDDIVSVPYERSCTHITHHWFKCRRGGMEKRTLYHVGPGRSRISTRRLEHLLLKHRSELYRYLHLKLDDYKVERGT